MSNRKHKQLLMEHMTSQMRQGFWEGQNESVYEGRVSGVDEHVNIKVGREKRSEETATI